ncbi:hypothetical protein ACLBXM_12775 [Xanthobacteraceae bacterium A53D]
MSLPILSSQTIAMVLGTGVCGLLAARLLCAAPWARRAHARVISRRDKNAR